MVSRAAKKKTRKPRYEPLLKMPPLSHEEYRGLASLDCRLGCARSNLGRQ